MNKKLAIYVCSFLIPEVAEVLKQGDYPDVQLFGFPADCQKSMPDPTSIISMHQKSEVLFSEIVLFGGTCHVDQLKNLKLPDVKVSQIKFTQCFEMFLNIDTLDYFSAKGYYLVTNGWLRNLENHKRKWGFDRETAHAFFGESMKGILFLDTKIEGDSLPNLKDLSDFTGLPYEIFPVGLSYCQKYIDSIVFNWRNDTQHHVLIEGISETTRKYADYLVLFNQLDMLVNLVDEQQIIQVGLDLLKILFAPSKISYISYNEKGANFEKEGVYNGKEPSDENSFQIEIKYQHNLLGVFKICCIQFPQFIEQYQKMGEVISNIFGLLITNSQKYEITVSQSEKLQVYSEELKQSNYAKDKFLSIIAHDLKGPFNSLLGISGLLSEEISAGNHELVVEYSNVLNKTIHQTYNLLINLLDWSRSQMGNIEFKPEYVLLAKSIGTMAELMELQAENKGVIIKMKIPAKLLVYGDKNMIETIVRNLISNSIKYSNKGGKIIISAEKKENAIVISVSDTGIGIKNENLEKLFRIEKSISTLGTSNEKGTGLGLLLCREFVEKHEGKIWVESVVGKGSRFYFSLPDPN